MSESRSDGSRRSLTSFIGKFTKIFKYREQENEVHSKGTVSTGLNEQKSIVPLTKGPLELKDCLGSFQRLKVTSRKKIQTSRAKSSLTTEVSKIL